MKAVILIGGQGTRLRPLTCNIPKSMVPILNEPFLEYLLLYLKKHGITDVVLAMGYLPDAIQKGLGDGSRLGMRLTYSVEPSPMGTAGAVKFAEPHLDREPFLVFNGDIITEIDLGAMIKLHRELGAKASIALTPVDNPTAFGVVETQAEGRITRFVEKPKPEQVTTNMINAGIYILQPEVLDLIPAGSHYMFEHHLFPLLLHRGDFMLAYPSQEYWIDIGTPEKYLKVHHDLLSKMGHLTHNKANIHPTARLGGTVMFGDGCVIEAGARLIGPLALGPGCHIGENATIEGSVLWDHVIVRKRASISNSIIGSGALIESKVDIPDQCVIGDKTVILEDTHLPAGSKVWPGLRVGEADLPLKPPQ